jgi:hypothetical protein
MEDLTNYIFKGRHAEVMQNRKQWFENFGKLFTAFWYVPAGHAPTVDEAIARLTSLQEKGATSFAFDFKTRFPKPA